MKKRQIAIVHFNTPELTEAAILSVRKHGGENYDVLVFDNSDCRPFIKKMDGVTVLDNTRGQILDLDAELRKYPNRSYYMGCAEGNNFGSVKHTLSVQWLMDNLDEPFLLMDSDILLKANVEQMFMDEQCCVGHVQTWMKSKNPFQIDRIVPILLFINPKLCREGGAKFFDPERSFGLQKGGRKNKRNWYDTGASFLEDIKTKKPQCHGKAIDIRTLMVHFQSGSWRRLKLNTQLEWLEANKELWKPSEDYVLGTKPKFAANKNAKIFVCAHADFEPVVSNPVYEVIDGREGGDIYNGIQGSFYSELLQMNRIAQRKKLPSIVGFCQYRKYFHWMNDVPSLSPLLNKYGCVVSQRREFDMSVREQYLTLVGNVEDLDIATAIIEKKHPEFANAWHGAIDSNLLHIASMFVMKSKDFLEMLALINDVVDGYVKKVGKDIDKRIKSMPQKYHLLGSTIEYQRRIGGQLCERLVSAWIDWKFPEAKEVPVKFTLSKPIPSN